VGLAVDPDLQDALVRNPAQDAVGQAPGVEHAHGAGFDDAGALALCHVLTGLSFQTTQSIPLRRKQVRDGQTGRARADDHHGRGFRRLAQLPHTVGHLTTSGSTLAERVR